MSALLRVGTKVRTTDRGARVHGRAPDKPEAIGTVSDHYRPYGRQSKDRAPPYYVTFDNGEAAWYDASEVEPMRGARSLIKPHHATKKKSPAQLDREIAEALAGSRSTKRQLPPIPKVTSDSRERALIEEAAEAVYNRPGGEDLTKEEFREEVYGFLNFPFDLRATETLVDKLYAYFQSPRTRPWDSSHAAMKKAAMTAKQFNVLATRATETLLQDDFDALIAAVRKLQPKTIIGVYGDYGYKKGTAEGRFIQLLETSPISAPWSRQVVVEEIVPEYRQGKAPRRLEVSPYTLRASQKTRFVRA